LEIGISIIRDFRLPPHCIWGMCLGCFAA